MRKTRLFLIICLVLILVLMLIYHKTSRYREFEIFREAIIEKIEVSNIEQTLYEIHLDEITGFEWDKAVIFYPGTSNKEISNLLGINYSGNIDLQTGIIFLSHNEIVLVDTVAYDPDRKATFQYYVDVQQNKSSAKLYTLTDDKVFVKKSIDTDDVIYTIMTHRPPQ